MTFMLSLQMQMNLSLSEKKMKAHVPVISFVHIIGHKLCAQDKDTQIHRSIFIQVCFSLKKSKSKIMKFLNLLSKWCCNICQIVDLKKMDHYQKR